MIILFITYHVNHLVNGKIGKTQFGRTYILCHINRSSVGTEKQFMVKSFSGQVGPYGTVLSAIEETFLQALHNFLLTFQVGFRLIVNLVESNSHHAVSLIKSCVYPVIHLFPQSTYFRIIGFPLHQHFTRLFHQRWFSFRSGLGFFFAQTFTLELRHQLFDFSLVMLIESHIIITNQMITFLSGRLGSFTVAILLPRQHRLTDMNTTVIHNICLYHSVAIGRNDICQCITQQVIADMA